MNESERPESFELDHTKVKAPYVRLAGRYQGREGDVVSKYDLRLVQPNCAEVIDASPMGCRTGFYLTVLGEPRHEDVRAAFEAALGSVAAHEGEVPGCSELRCGNWRDHSLPGAKAWAAAVLERPIIVQDTIRIV